MESGELRIENGCHVFSLFFVYSYQDMTCRFHSPLSILNSPFITIFAGNYLNRNDEHP